MQYTYANGWTASVIDDGYGGEDGYFETWAWHEDGTKDPDVTGWQTPEQVGAFLIEVAARPRPESAEERHDREIDEAKAFGKRLKALVEACEGETAGLVGVSLIDTPTKGTFVAHTHDGQTYVIEFTRCDD